MADKTEQTLNPSEQTILDMIRKLEYGEVKITVHNQKPVLLEVTKKIKF